MPTLSIHGDVHIPDNLIHALGLKPGVELIVERQGDAIVMRPLKTNVPSQVEDGPKILGYSGSTVSLEEMDAAIAKGFDPIEKKILNTNQDLSTLRDDVFQNIGRNLFDFQKIELMLKHLVVNAQRSGYISEFKKNQEKKVDFIRKNTMGGLVGEFVETIFQSVDSSSEPISESIEPYFSSSFSLEADLDFYENKARELKSLVDARNDLVHHLLPRFDTESLESCLEIKIYLDQQRERLKVEFKFLKSLIEDRDKVANMLAAFFSSDEAEKVFELCFLRQSSIVQLLQNVAVQKARSDGWTYLSIAIKQIRQELPGEMEELKNLWGYQTLPDLIKASGYFDIRKEEVNKDYRWIYRLQPVLVNSSELIQEQ